MAHVKQAEAYIRLAEELLAKDPVDSDAIDIIVDNYEKAANIYLLGGNNLKAGALYGKCAAIYVMHGKSHLSLDFYSSAISAYKEDHLQLAITTAKQLALIAMQIGHYAHAGKVLQDLAVGAEAKEDYEEAYGLYTRAVTAFSNDHASVNEHRNCKIRLAELGALLGKNYEISASLFEDAAIECTQMAALHDLTRTFFLSAFICMALFQEQHLLHSSLQRFEKHDRTLVGSPEGEFMYECLMALKKNDGVAYETAVTKLRNRLGISLTVNAFKCKTLILIGEKVGCNAIGSLL